MDRMYEDLKASGLVPEDIDARPLSNPERQAIGVGSFVDGYVIPYRDLYGSPLPFYRAKLFDSEIKYKQVKKTRNHIYYPKLFGKCMRNNEKKVIILTEGEKKAAAACKMGFAACSLSGVDSWRTRVFTLPAETELEKSSSKSGNIRVTIPSGMSFSLGEAIDPMLADGLEDLLNTVRDRGFTLMFIYDNDSSEKSAYNVQKSAARLALYVRNYGVPMRCIKQIKLPIEMGEPKAALDDFLVEHGAEALDRLIDEALEDPASFPRHPDIRNYVNQKLNQGHLDRNEYKFLSMSILADMDASGVRMNSKKENQTYYFHRDKAALHKVYLNPARMEVQNTTFSRFLYNKYGISIHSDQRLVSWLSTQYAAEDPVLDVNPHRIIALPQYHEDIVRFQISDGEYMKVSAKGTEIVPNGSDNILFEADRTEPLDVEKFWKHYREQKNKPLTNRWEETLKTTRIADDEKHIKQVSLLSYASPFLFRWRGTQLPVEIWIGESGSGKSSTMELRLETQTGRPELKNRPGNMKDWHAALANSGGLHVTDNVQLHDKSLRDMLSDEICRLITEPVPHVEMRKLYSDAEQVSLSVNNVFVFTAIQQPFLANDLLQRSLVVRFDKGDKDVSYNSNWKANMLRSGGGREGWLAHQCLVLEAFFKAVEKHWRFDYKAQHRLINYEQILKIMGEHVFGENMSWLPNKLAADVRDAVASNDFALEGLTTFAREVAPKMHKKDGIIMFTASDVVSWASNHAEFADCALLINARKLGTYMANAKHMLSQVTGIKEANKKIANKTAYTIEQK